MAVTQVSRRPQCSSKSFKNVSRGPSLETTTAGSSSSCAGNASPVFDTSTTLIFVDWDDTLFPSTEVFDRWGLQLRSYKRDDLNAEQQLLVNNWKTSLQRFMKAIMEFSGHCAIVTNAQISWVEDCLHRFAPEVLQSLSGPGGPTILHAKDVLRSLRSRKKIWQHDEIAIPARYADVYRDDDIKHFKFVEMTAAKYQAMRLEFNTVFAGRNISGCNIINFGDMEYEHEAVLELGMRLSEVGEEPLIKSFLLPEAPKITELAVRLDLLRLLLPAIVCADADIALNFKESGSTPMALLSKALRIPDLERIEFPHVFGCGQPPSENEVTEFLQEVAVALAFRH